MLQMEYIVRLVLRQAMSFDWSTETSIDLDAGETKICNGSCSRVKYPKCLDSDLIKTYVLYSL